MTRYFVYGVTEDGHEQLIAPYSNQAYHLQRVDAEIDARWVAYLRYSSAVIREVRA